MLPLRIYRIERNSRTRVDDTSGTSRSCKGSKHRNPSIGAQTLRVSVTASHAELLCHGTDPLGAHSPLIACDLVKPSCDILSGHVRRDHSAHFSFDGTRK
jgi:hypothetical protein